MATSSSILGAIGNLPRSIPRNLPTRSPGLVQPRPAPNIGQANALLAAQKAAAQRAQMQRNRGNALGGIFGGSGPINRGQRLGDINPRIPRRGTPPISMIPPFTSRPATPPNFRLPTPRARLMPMPRDRAFLGDIRDGMNARQRFLKNNIGSIFGPRPNPKPSTRRLPRRRVQPTSKAVDPNRRDRSRRATPKKKPISVTELRRKAGTLPTRDKAAPRKNITYRGPAPSIARGTKKPLPRRRATPVKKGLGPRGPQGPKGPGGPKSVRKPIPRRRVLPKTRTSTTNNQRRRGSPRRRVMPRRR